MAIIGKESIETLKTRIDLIEVLSPYVELKRAGAVYKGLCPFHDEKTPSFTVQKGDGHYHCFGCGAHGDAIEFLLSYLKLGFREAIETLAEKFHVHLDYVEGGEGEKGPNKTLLRDAMSFASELYRCFLLHTEEGHRALDYLYGRGIDLDFIRQFQVGFSLKEPGVFRKAMHAKGFSDEILLAAGLLAETQQGRKREFFYDRITFPIHSPSGGVIGFSARKFREETFGGKYVNTPETPLFKKSRVLFGLNYSRRRIAKEKRAVIVEGQIDALRLIQAGFNLTVAGQGTAFGEGHVKELVKLGVSQVYLAFDSDAAGKEAAVKVGNLFQSEGCAVYIAALPIGQDPDSYLRQNGVEAFQALLDESVEYLPFLFELRSGAVRMDNPAEKTALVQSIVQMVRKWKSDLHVHESLRQLASIAGVPEDFVGVGQKAPQNILIRKSANIGQQVIDTVRILEADFIRWLIRKSENWDELVALARETLPPEELKDPVCRSIYQKILANGEVDYFTLAENEENQALLQLVSDRIADREKALPLLMESIKKILDRNWMEKGEELRKKIQGGNLPDEELTKLLKQFDELKKNPPKVELCT